jgi:hypothetical protein
MSIEVVCKCGKVIHTPDSTAGKKGRCKACGAILEIPSVGFALLDDQPGTGVELETAPERSRAVRQTPAPAPAAARPAPVRQSRPAVREPIPAAPVGQNVQVNIAEPQKGNALAVAALVLGILAALVCWVPFLGLLAVPVGLIGLGPHPVAPD